MNTPNKVEGCWAASLEDCGGKLSREHTVSGCLFPSGLVTVSGLDWCKNEAKTIGLGGLVSKILCEHHNSELSDLDSTMLQYFECIREVIRLNDLRSRLRQKTWTVRRFQVDGQLMERWFLKTLININFEGKWKIGESEESYGVPPTELVKIAFGKGSFQKHAGLYLAAGKGEMITMREGVSVRALSEGESLIAGEFIICGYSFILSLVPEQVETFAGRQLLHKQIKLKYRVPDHKGRQVLSHVLDIK